MEQFDFIFVDERRSGVSTAVVVSLVFHVLFIVYIIYNYHPVSKGDAPTPMVHYVELIRQNPQFTEAPGPKVKSAPLTAPFSDANRRASTPHPTGEQPTARPGEGGFYTPQTRSANDSPSVNNPARPQQQQRQQQQPAAAANAAENSGASSPTFAYRPNQSNGSGYNRNQSNGDNNGGNRDFDRSNGRR